MSMKAPIVGILIILIGLVTVSTYSLIEAKPVRRAVINDGDNYRAVTLKPFQIVTDPKAIDFVVDIVAECFSLTAINITSKSEYCQNRYFSRNASIVYQTRFVAPLETTLEANDASYYSVVERSPIILSTPIPSKPYYVMYAPILSTTVLRTRRPAERYNIRIWVEPTTRANNPKMYQIIGFQL